MLRLGAVIGDELDLAVLRAVSGLDDAAVSVVVDAAVGAGLLIEPPGSRQRVALADAAQQRAFLGAVDPATRAAWHGAIADEIERVAG